MTNEEKVIDGILHFKIHPKGEWYPYGSKAINKKLIKSKQKINSYLKALKWFCDRVDKGEVRSKKTYTKFKELIKNAE